MPNTEGTNNVFLTDDIIMSETLLRLDNKLVAMRLVNRTPERYFGKIGDTISVKLPYRTKVASGRTLVRQPMVDRSVSFAINNQAHFALTFTVNDRTLSIDQFAERYLDSGIQQLASAVDLSILQEAIDTSFYATGTPGEGTTYETMIDAIADATLVGHPVMDGRTNICLNPRDAAAHRKKLARVASSDSIVTQAIKRSYLDSISGIDVFDTAQMPTHTNGVATGTPLTNAAVAQTGASLITDGWTNSTTGILKKGDIFTIADVYSVNPQTYVSTGILQQFVVTADVNSGASTGPATISISPAINDGTLTTTDAEGNTVSLAAYQNVTNAAANDKAIVVLGTGSTQYRQNLMLHRDAIMFAAVDLYLPQSAPVKVRKSHPESGLSLSMTAAYNINDAEETYRIDVLWGVKNVYPELSRRVFGTAA